MTKLVEVLAGDNLSTLASRALGDPSRFREILELNDVSDIFNLVPGQIFESPLPSELQQLTPALTGLRTQVSGTLEQAKEIVSRARSYTQVARDAAGEVNGITQEIDSVLDDALEFIDVAGDETGRITDWLLDRTEIAGGGTVGNVLRSALGL